ncbi:hypothetical protein [Psychroflexus sp. ALD_RP9]|uniref:hypothetical protein n=1 Tax=Psychroflexus sp. ALD_RP9 TaxID=2777186 RepID=UPI001A8EA210|nr:hypothetical protein [Psychroflexus sp. ALD_RP9]QSS96035.1 hypothetical protein IMZ30_06080 [Psychroflexus sp. ALD_RP9]
MNKTIFNSIAIVLMAIILLSLNELNVLEASAKFMFIPLLGFYFLGQYSEQKFPSNKNK